WIVPAGVQNNKIQAVAGILHRIQNQIEVDRQGTNLPLLADIGTDRQQVIFAFHLHSVSSVVEESDAAVLNRPGKSLDSVNHLLIIDIGLQRHFEADIAEGCSDVSSVGNRVFEAAELVSAVADDQGDTPLCIL